MIERRWETRLLALLAAVLVVFGLVAVYGASSLVTTPAGDVGAGFALRQLFGAIAGGIVATVVARSDYHRWQRAAWPLLAATALLLAVGSAPLLFSAVASAQYRLARVLTFLNPGSAPAEATWQVHQSLVGIGAGKLLGVGLGQGQQKLGYLPYAYSDFIFSTIGEEWGFLGVLAIVVLFGTFMWVGFRIARSARDAFGQLLAVGLTALIGFAALLHIAVSLGLLPATGITLPFISYGRSSLFVALVATGVLASVGRGRKVT